MLHKILPIIIIVLLCVILVATLINYHKGGKQEIKAEKVREYANELYDRYLHEQAIEQYRYYLEQYTIPLKEQANIHYRIANIYFERMADYQKALAEYLRIKVLYPESELMNDVNKRIVACLERLQRPEDAQQALRESASLEPSKQESRPGTLIAKIGERNVTQGDIDFEIGQLPPEIRSQFQDKAKKVEFLKRFVATEIMYDSAKRAGFDNDKNVLEYAWKAKKSFMVQKLLQQKIGEKVKIQPQDVELYYQAHKDRYVEKDKEGKVTKELSLSEAQQQVAQDLMYEREQAAYQELIASLLRADNIKIYDDLVQ